MKPGVRGQRSEIRGQLGARMQNPEFRRKAIKKEFFSTTGY
jgi:hypothetical protein